MRAEKTRLKIVEEKIVLAYNAVNSAASICNDSRLKSDLENEKEKLYDILVKCEMIANGDEESTPVESSRKAIKSSLDGFDAAMKCANILDRYGASHSTPSVENIDGTNYVVFKYYGGPNDTASRNDDSWDEMGELDGVVDVGYGYGYGLENTKYEDSLLIELDKSITSSRKAIKSSAIGGKLRKVDKYGGGREVDRAFNSDSFADFKRHIAKAVEKANQNGSRMLRDKWEDIVEFTEPELKYLFNGPDGYNLPTSTERTLSPEEKKQRKQWQDDFTYGEDVHSIGYNED